MDENIYYMNMALNAAKLAFKRQEVPVGAIILLDDKTLVKGHNKRYRQRDITNHAEMVVLKKASKILKDWRLDGATMYVTLYPCPMCASAIVQSRIKKLVIGAPCTDSKNKKIVEMIFEDSIKNGNLTVVENILENECSNILKEFFLIQRNK